MDLLYFALCMLTTMLICIIIGAGYVPPWELFRNPFRPPNIYLLVAIVFMGIVGGSFLYTDNELKRWIFETLFRFDIEIR